jgi:anti-sigma factor RsiW
MSHLTLEELARLVDQPPTSAERDHLTSCAVCAVELEALTAQRDALRALPDLAPPSDGWPALRAALKREGLLRDSRPWFPILARAAAAAFLFLAGGATGYAVRGPTAPGASEQPAGFVAADPVSAPIEVEAAGELFMEALDRYMAGTEPGTADPAARLAALDNIVLTTAEALNEAPGDPVINGYHLAALAQRNAVLRQLAARGEPVF